MPGKWFYRKYFGSHQRFETEFNFYDFFVIEHMFDFEKFSELNGEAKSKTIQLEKNIAQNLTCFQGSKGNRIQWLKVNCFIHFEFFLLAGILTTSLLR
jgi:hypothetical protein